MITPTDNGIFAALAEIVYTRDERDQHLQLSDLGSGLID